VGRQATIAVGQMLVGDEGYCSSASVYVTPSSPRGSDEGRDVAATAHFLLADADVYPDPSPIAKVRVKRLEGGVSIHLAPGEVASRYFLAPTPGSLPVVAIE
jgi:hypothetical protein